jgi:hypothetical protein
LGAQSCLHIIENLDLEKPSFRPSKWPRKLKPAKNSKLPKLPESRFEPFGKGGWPPISTWIKKTNFIVSLLFCVNHLLIICSHFVLLIKFGLVTLLTNIPYMAYVVKKSNLFVFNDLHKFWDLVKGHDLFNGTKPKALDT